MRTLPDNPSLEYLRREAKDVLAGLRESGPGASLADAQRSLAEQYGFRTWTDLKAEVDRRRAGVQPGDPELARELAAAFGLGAVVGPMMPTTHKVTGQQWTLETDRGRWIVVPMFDWVDEAQAQTGVQLLEAARAAGVSVPRPVRSPSGRLVERIAERNWRADEWMDLGPWPAHPVRASVATKVGETLATLHSLAIRPARGTPPFLTYRRPRADWDELLTRATSARVDWAPALASVLPTVLELAALETGPAPSEPILCHSDLIPEVVRMGRGDDVVVLHWDFAGPLVPEWELGYVLLHWALILEPADRVNVVAARAIADGYRSRGGVFPTLDRSTFAVAISGWLNYTYGQICTAIDEQDPDRRRFATGETSGLLADPMSVAKLERLIRALEHVAG